MDRSDSHDASNARIALKRGSRGPAGPGPPRKGEGERSTRPSKGEGTSDKKRCPFCGGEDSEVISLFGSQVMTMQLKCRTCGSFYEASKY